MVKPRSPEPMHQLTIFADATGDAGQRKTRLQSHGEGPSTSAAAQLITATSDHMSLATAMLRMNENSASNLGKGGQPQWDFKVEPCTDFQHKVEIWAASYDIEHLLERDLHIHMSRSMKLPCALSC